MGATVSVVTPFYNTESYLAECIESVLEQSYDDWEYILLNNQSTDRSRSIAQHYAEQDERIRLFDTETFLEQVPNYNRALRLVSPDSEYVKLVQADDWLFPECLELMVDLAARHPQAGIIGSYTLAGTRVEADGLPYPSACVPGSTPCRLHLLESVFVFGSPTCVMYRSEIVRQRDPFYNESSYHSDTEACYEILRDWDFGFVHQVTTFKRVEEMSIGRRVRRFDPAELDNLTYLYKYGADHLSAEELTERIKRVERKYYNWLARRPGQLLDSRFRAFHIRSLEDAGTRLSFGRLAVHVAIKAVYKLLNPGMLVRDIAMRLTRGRAR